MSQSPVSHTLRFVILASLAGIAVGTYFETVRSMVEIWWRSETFTHAFLVPPIVGWLCWRQWPTLQQLPAKPAAWALLPMVLAGLAWLLGDLVAVNTVTQFAVVTMLVLLVPLVFGWTWTGALLFPLGFFYFCVPLGEFAMPRLMEWTADFTVQALRLSGVPVFREGLQFVIPTGTWSVVEACSGIRYIIASLTVGTLFAYLNYHGTRKRLIFVGVALLVPILANWVRAYLIVMLGHFSGNKLAAGVDHLIYGWVFFGLVIMLMFMIGAKWSDGQVSPPPIRVETRTTGQNGVTPVRGSVLVLSASLSVLLLPWMAAAALDGFNNKTPVMFPERMPLSKEWQEIKGAHLDWSPDFKNPSANGTWWFEKKEQQVGVYIAYYRNQDAARKLVSSDNVLVRSNNPKWARISSARRELQIGPSITLPVQHAVLRAGHVGDGKDAARMHVYQTYWVNRAWIAGDVQAKIAGALSQLRGKGDDSAVLVLYTLSESDEDSKRLLDEFLQDQLTQLDSMLTAMSAVTGRGN